MATLYVVATPIGNMEDITHRAVRVLGEVTVLACEDSRMTRKLFARYEIPLPRTIIAYHEHNEVHAGKRLLGLLDDGVDVALCSDGGCPGISDPGYRILDACHEAGHSIGVLPGASAVHTALLASGLSTSSYLFKGFPPRKSGQRQRFLEPEKDLPHTLIFFESPYRVGAFLKDARVVLGNRIAAVCIELTKRFERVHRAPLDELIPIFAEGKVKGEVSIVIAGNHPKFYAPSDNDEE